MIIHLEMEQKVKKQKRELKRVIDRAIQPLGWTVTNITTPKSGHLRVTFANSKGTRKWISCSETPSCPFSCKHAAKDAVKKIKGIY